MSAVHVDEALRGRARTEALLVEAMCDLLAREPISGISVAKVSETAHVNAGLIHHYFGSKDGLVTAALAKMSDEVLAIAQERIFAALDQGPDVALRQGMEVVFDPAETRVRRYFRAVLMLASANAVPADLRANFPVARIFLLLGGPLFGLPEDQVREWAAQAATLTLGWLLMEPYMLETVGLEGQEARMRASLLDGVIRLAQFPQA